MDIDENNQLVPVVDQLNTLQQNLTSSNGIRDELVNTAVSFLLNPKIQSTTLAQKRGFLLNKGLNNDEIDLAIERTLFSLSGNQEPFNYHHNAAVNPLFYRPPTFWSITRLITPSVLLIGGLIYGIYQLIEKFIKPLIYGQEACRSSLDIVRSELSYLRQSIKNLEDNLLRVEENVRRNLEIELQQARTQDYAGIAAINEMKSELTSMKSLMLNKDQFPLINPLKSISASIPEWQKDKKTDDSNTKLSNGELNNKINEELNNELIDNKLIDNETNQLNNDKIVNKKNKKSNKELNKNLNNSKLNDKKDEMIENDELTNLTNLAV